MKSTVPEEVVLNQLFKATYEIKNVSEETSNTKLNLQKANYFFSIGEPKQRFKLEPGASQSVTFELLPLKLGYHQILTVEIDDFVNQRGVRTKQEIIRPVSQQYVRVIAPRVDDLL